MLNGLPTDADLARIRAHGEVQRQKIPKNVFVAGPRIDQTKPYKDVKYEIFAAELRHQLCEVLAAEHFTIYAGENEELLKAAEAMYGTANNSQLSESYIAREFAAAVIIIPDSPGSFAELGAWSGCSIISPKMLILVEKKYETDPGYLMTGPVTESIRNNAKVFYYEKDKLSDVFDQVKKFVDGKIINASVSDLK